MNELAYFHSQRLQFAAARIARDLQAMRSDPTLPKLYQEIYLSLQVRLSAVTAARITFAQWVRQHPNASDPEVRKALRDMNIPTTLPALRRAIRKIKRDVRKTIKNRLAFREDLHT